MNSINGYMYKESKKIIKQLEDDCVPSKVKKVSKKKKKRYIEEPTNEISLPTFMLFWMAIIYSMFNMLIKY